MSGFMLYYKAGGREIMDPRFVRKETEIRVALLKLLETTPIADISTTALCKQAGISRNTFYCHYPSPAALLETIENEFIDLIVGIVNKTIDSDYESLLRQICQAMLDNRKLATLLLSDNG
ncbi:MAG: TetR/AcrR family transcriptional regulator, partial [Clostridia bacterium]|nr:TetR/AcrR family transcriptional regulator [Clostridia bacterium]